MPSLLCEIKQNTQAFPTVLRFLLKTKTQPLPKSLDHLLENSFPWLSPLAFQECVALLRIVLTSPLHGLEGSAIRWRRSRAGSAGLGHTLNTFLASRSRRGWERQSAEHGRERQHPCSRVRVVINGLGVCVVPLFLLVWECRDSPPSDAAVSRCRAINNMKLKMLDSVHIFHISIDNC